MAESAPDWLQMRSLLIGIVEVIKAQIFSRNIFGNIFYKNSILCDNPAKFCHLLLALNGGTDMGMLTRENSGLRYHSE